MNEDIKECTFIRNSSNQSFSFYINAEYNLIFNELDDDNNYMRSAIVESDVLDFSVTIDNNDKLHLLYLLKRGELIYSIYLNETWQKSIIKKLDTKSNIYRYLNLFIYGSHISIFYVFTNLINTNLWTIEQITKGAINWQKRTVANIFSERNFSPFYIDKDRSGNVYLIYRAKEYNSNHIYYTFYNIFAEKWTPIPMKISSSVNNILPYLFVDSRDNIHVLWYSLNDSDYLLTYKRLSSMGKNTYQWADVRLPRIISSNYPSIIFEKDNKLNITYITNEEICLIVSKDYGDNWSLEDKVSLSKHPTNLIKYSSSISSGGKINHRYGIVDNKIDFCFDNNLSEEAIDEVTYAEDDSKGTQSEQRKTAEVGNNQLLELKNILLEAQDQLVENFNSIEEKLLTLEQTADIINNIQKEVDLIKEKVIKLEEKQNNKKGFWGF